MATKVFLIYINLLCHIKRFRKQRIISNQILYSLSLQIIYISLSFHHFPYQSYYEPLLKYQP